jgi:pyrroline-5-carboxylate reductase
MKITFVGGGNMAQALIGGLVAAGRATGDVRVVEPLLAQREKLSARFPGLALFGDMCEGAVFGADIVVLAVKPQQMRVVANALAPWADLVPVVLSIAAGTRIKDIARWLGGYARIARAMPNTPALVGAGISGAFAQAAVDTAGRACVTRVLEAAGEVIWCADEAMLDAVTGVSGSGPAYVFYFLEGLERAACELGFTAADARTLAYATFAGAVKLAQGSSDAPGTLRVQVTSKGGTTERALATMDAANLQDHFVAAVKAAATRATELGEQLGAES